jgi:hypothetical protein
LSERRADLGVVGAGMTTSFGLAEEVFDAWG